MSISEASEMPIVVSIDHFIGQQATAVLPGSDSWAWGIQLESGTVIGNKDPERADAPEGIVGKVFCVVTMGELDTRMQFGITTPDGVVEEVWVELTPTLYTIAGISGQAEEYYPQAAPTIADALPEDPSDDRVADGPTGDEE